jgi:hypothetical protein
LTIIHPATPEQSPFIRLRTVEINHEWLPVADETIIPGDDGMGIPLIDFNKFKIGTEMPQKVLPGRNEFKVPIRMSQVAKELQARTPDS